ncbi:MFS transporter [Schlegelella sp. S2-27]|uniref:MFS transporter n=1 Tax=Caldimonas mangrovi TaxID=2944811 RepID=A0ABT0YUH1_9BURK|nr:MFS transporter [Caldimonas mangrovi]MCM5682400.1 MFS transporter [Caldimonas mangrovi]
MDGHAPSRQGQAGAREWAGLALLALPSILLGLDLTLLHLAMPALAVDLRPTSAQVLWIMDAYGFMIAGFLVTMGTLGDRIGRRKLLLIGSVSFGAVSVVAAYSTTPAMLIAARAALGVAGATLMPSTLALITTMFVNPRQRALAIGVWATMFALGMAAGPVVGGALLQHHGWGAAFLVAVPVSVLVLAGAPLLLPEYRAPHHGRLDLQSVALSLAALLPIIYGVKQAAKDGLSHGSVLPVVLGAAAMVLFVRRQRRLADPMVDLTLLSNGSLRLALAVLLIGLIGVGGTMLLVTQYLQLVVGLSPLAAGMWMGPPALAMLAAGIAAPLLARRLRAGDVIAAALGCSVVGYFLLTQLAPFGCGIALATASFSLVYLGLGTIAALGTDLVVGSAPADKAGAASAISETVQELGLALGIATLGSLTTAVYRARLADQLPATLDPALQKTVADSLASAMSVAPQLPPGLVEQAKNAFLAGLSTASIATGICVAALALLVALKFHTAAAQAPGTPPGVQ